MSIRVIMLSLLVLLGGWALTRAQGIPVYDNTNFLQNIVTAGQTTLTAANTVKMLANDALNLTSLPDIVVAQGIADDMAALSAILRDAGALSNDVGQLNSQIRSLFSLESMPRDVDALQVRMAEIQHVVYEARSYAVRTQALAQTMQNTVRHLTALVTSIKAFIGSKQGQQALAELSSSSGQTLAMLEVQSAAYQRAEVLEKMGRDLVIQSINHIDYERLGSMKPK